MKRFTFLSIVLLLLTVGISGQLYAQGGSVIVAPPNNPDTDGDGLPDSDDQCPNKKGPRENRGCPTGGSSDNDSGSDDPVDDPTNDSDGDGLSDPDDQCPHAGGPTWTGGCPEDDVPPPSQPDPNDVPDPGRDDPFIPPVFPSDGCYVTPNGNFSVNVRKATDVTALQLGYLLPGVVYKSDGYMTVGADNWFVMNEYENNADDTGYAFGGVLLSSGCDQSIGSGVEPAADDVTARPSTPLCHLTVGYDSPTWSNDPAVPSYTYAAFWFAMEPGQPIPAGTQAWGVIYVADFITLPDHNNIVAIAPDAALFAEASNSPYAGFYNWPTMHGGIQSGDTQLFRLSPPYNSGACGPIVGIDDFAPAPDVPDDGVGVIQPSINEFACTMETPFNWVFAFNYAPDQVVPAGTHPIAILNGDHEIAGDVNLWTTSMKLLGDKHYEYISYEGWAELPRTGGDCGWSGDHASVAVLGHNNFKQIGIAVHTYHDAGQDGNDLLIVNNGDGSDFLEDDGDLDLYLVNAPGGDNDPDWPWQVGVLIVFGEEVPTRNTNTVEYCIYLEVQEAGVFEEVCYEVEVPLGCTLVAQEAGVYKLVCIDDLQNDGESDDETIDTLSIGDQGETRKEDAAWWATVLDLACPGGWSYITEIDADGDEVVTDVTSCKGENE